MRLLKWSLRQIGISTKVDEVRLLEKSRTRGKISETILFQKLILGIKNAKANILESFSIFIKKLGNCCQAFYWADS